MTKPDSIENLLEITVFLIFTTTTLGYWLSPSLSTAATLAMRLNKAGCHNLLSEQSLIKTWPTEWLHGVSLHLFLGSLCTRARAVGVSSCRCRFSSLGKEEWGLCTWSLSGALAPPRVSAAV